MANLEFYKGFEYKGFDTLDVISLPSYNSTGIYLRHKKTGLQIFHMKNDDEENLFAFAFGTPAMDSKGAAHIMEHSVLCGSEKYPLKDAFLCLENQSIKTFLNALTFPDKTVFPASSQLKQDYFNLMDVYGDAVFFPLLKKEIFLQEGHHLEIDQNGKKIMQGVVFNEMKGNYASFNSVANDAVAKNLVGGTIYAMDSGGDPLSIPSLSYEEFLAFHKKFYRPSNCHVFLYGNIATEEQLDFIQTHFLDRLEARGCKDEGAVEIATESEPIVTPYAEEIGPSSVEDGNDKPTVALSWLLGGDTKAPMSPMEILECTFLRSLLCGSDSSPLIKAVVDSHLGEDISPLTGSDTSTRFSDFTIALRGIEKEKAKQFKDLVYSTLKNLCENGINPDDIKSTILSAEFSYKEIIRYNGPYSLILMRRCLSSWLYGGKPWTRLQDQVLFDSIKKNLDSDKNYIAKLIKKYFLDNDKVSLVVITPSANYTKEREAQETAIIEEEFSKTTEEAVKKELSLLHDFQQQKDTEDMLKLIPHIRPSDLPDCLDKSVIKLEKIKGINGSDIPLFVSNEHTNGIIYTTVCFPLDAISVEDYPYIPFFMSAVTSCGWGKYSWAEAMTLIDCTCGGFSCNDMTIMPSDDSIAPLDDNGKVASYYNREWIVFKVKMLNEQCKDAFDVISDCINETDFSDSKRLYDLAVEYRNNQDSCIVPDGHIYAISRARCKDGHARALDELWDGISQLYTLHTISEMNMEELGKKLHNILTSLRNSGSIVHIIADDEGLDIAKKNIPELVKKLNLTAPIARSPIDDGELMKMIDLPKKFVENKSEKGAEIINLSAQVGFAGLSCKIEEACSEDGVVLTHLLNNSALWEQIRTVGGAYGAFCGFSSNDKNFYFATYRDPKTFRSVKILKSCIEDFDIENISEEAIERGITGSYGKLIEPYSPSGHGRIDFMRACYGITDEVRRKRVDRLLTVNKERLKTFAKQLITSLDKATTAVLCGSGQLSDTDGVEISKIVTLP